jgi:predicted phosphodiesterase
MEKVPEPNQQSPEAATERQELSKETIYRLGKIVESLEKQDVDPGAVGAINEVRVSNWQVVTKDTKTDPETGEEFTEATVHDLEGTSIKFKPLNNGEEEDMGQRFITTAQPTVIKPSKRKQPKRSDQLTVAFGDAQIPFQDEDAMDMAVLACNELRPDNIVLTGDMLDLPALSKYEQRSEWQQTTQGAIDRYHAFLAQLRADNPNARIVAVGGNHEERMLRHVRNNAAELLGIRRANAAHELAVLTVPFLVRFEDLEVENVDGYPNAAHWLEENLKVTHGTNTRKGGSNAAKYLQEERDSTIFGHTHRLELAMRTFATRAGSLAIYAASPGCLALTDGSVPGFHHSVNSEGNTVKKTEDWQQGLIVAEHNPKLHHLTPVRMTEEGMSLWGKHYGRAA